VPPRNEPVGSTIWAKALFASVTCQPFGEPSTMTSYKPLSAMLTGVVRPTVMVPSSAGTQAAERA
jgi:hypothetical protein